MNIEHLQGNLDKQCYSLEGKYNKIQDERVLILQPDNTMITKVVVIKISTLDITPDSTPIIKKNIIQIDDELSLETESLLTSRIYFGQIIPVTAQTFLPCDLTAVFFNLFLNTTLQRILKLSLDIFLQLQNY